MILISVQNNDRDFVMEISAGLAGTVLHAISPYNPVVGTSGKGNCVATVSMDHIDKLNKDLIPFKKELRFDKTFIDWKANNRGKKPVLLKAGPVFTKIYKSSDCDVPHKDLEDAMKYFFKPAVNQKAYKDKKWDGYIHLYKRWLHQFPTGLLDIAEEVLKAKGVPYKIEYTYETNPPRQFKWEAKDLFTLSEDQNDAISACLEAGRCVVKAATGFGRIAL